MNKTVATMDQVLTDANLPKQALFTPVETGLYQVDIALICTSPGSVPTLVQLTAGGIDPAMPNDGNGPVGVSNYIATLNASNFNARAIDTRLVALKANSPFNIEVVVLVKTGSVSYRIIANAIQMT